MKQVDAQTAKGPEQSFRSGLYDLVRKLPVIRARHLTTSPYHIGSVIENRLGLQVYRTIGKHITRRTRKRNVTPDIKHHVPVLDRDGILVIEDFLKAEQFKNVLAEFERANEGVSLKPYKNAEHARLYRTQLPVQDSPELFSAIRANFQENILLDRIASAITRRNVLGKPDIYLDTYRMLDDSGTDNDIENILHADLHVPTVKMFFYLTETNEANGAFVYAKGSHKLTLPRLIHEYELSIREAKLNRELPVPESLLERRDVEVRNIITPANRRRMNINETQFCVKPNTLVITNNMGFHRRGEFHGGDPRKALLINYRYLEKPFW